MRHRAGNGSAVADDNCVTGARAIGGPRGGVIDGRAYDFREHTAHTRIPFTADNNRSSFPIPIFRSPRLSFLLFIFLFPVITVYIYIYTYGCIIHVYLHSYTYTYMYMVIAPPGRDSPGSVGFTGAYTHYSIL